LETKRPSRIKHFNLYVKIHLPAAVGKCPQSPKLRIPVEPTGKEGVPMISKVTSPTKWVAVVWLFGFSLLAQQSQSAAKPDPANKPEPQAATKPEPQSAAKPEPQSATKPEIITTMTLESAQRIIQALGFEVTQDKDEKGQPTPYLSFRAEGYPVGASVPAPDYISLYNMFTDKATPATINEWNGRNRFCRAYTDNSDNADKNVVYLETEIIVHGGVTRENIEVQIKEFRDSVARWVRFLIDHKNKEAPAPPKP
jgi:hypothetical protein